MLYPEDKPCVCVALSGRSICLLNEHINDDVLFRELTDTTALPLPGRNLDNPLFAALGCFISGRQSLIRSDRSQEPLESSFSFMTVFCETQNLCTTKVSKPLDIITLNNPGLFIIFFSE